MKIFRLFSLLLVATVVSARIETTDDKARRLDNGGRGMYFVGYWIGIDPNDGGDTRRSITYDGDGQFTMLGRDTTLTLCGQQSGVITTTGGIEDGSLVVTGDLVCNNGPTIELIYTFTKESKNVAREVITIGGDVKQDDFIWRLVSPF